MTEARHTEPGAGWKPGPHTATHRLHGCRPAPLAHYLKALGILRLVSEQIDASARGYWERDEFVLESVLSRAQLEAFFLERYAPTAMVGPWGARSGFLAGSSEKSARAALDAIVASESPRMLRFRETITTVRALMARLGVIEKEQQELNKLLILRACRASLGDDVVPWLDACYVLTRDASKYPPLLGTGGNEGSGSYTSGFAQLVVECVIERKHEHALGAALWDHSWPDIVIKQSAGQFLPSAVQGQSSMNPWDYLLCLEGALVFAGALVRRGEAARESFSFPFTVQSVIAGYGSAAEEKNRGEMWLPLWRRPVKLPELVQLFSEGRGDLGRRRAKNGSDFARAACTLGVDRGITEFQRYGIQERNGQANLAIPLDRMGTEFRPQVALLGDIDDWLRRLRRRATTDRAPGSVKRCMRDIDEAILALCSHTHDDATGVRAMLVALGRCERALARSVKWAKDARVDPVPPLSARWLAPLVATANSVELRLAAALMSVSAQHGSEQYTPMRRHLEPVTVRVGKAGIWSVAWDERAARDVVWSDGHVIDTLNRVMHRRLVLAGMSGAPTYPDRGQPCASIDDIADFIDGRIDERELVDLMWALALLDWPAIEPAELPRAPHGREDRWPGALYAVLSLCFAPPARATQATRDKPLIPLVPRIHRLASTGNGAAASRAAVQRLRASGLAPALGPISMTGPSTRRTAAALLFPLADAARARLRDRVTKPDADPKTTANTNTKTKTTTNTKTKTTTNHDNEASAHAGPATEDATGVTA